jgi:hypothetical protein
MTKEKKSSTTPKKTAAKKSAGRKAASKKTPAEEAVAAAVGSSESPLSGRPAKTPQPSDAEIYEEIRVRAYEFFCERGGQHGSHEADWHRAESEIRSKYKKYK